MTSRLIVRLNDLVKGSVLLAACVVTAACSQQEQSLSSEDLEERRTELSTQLSDPVTRTRLIAKVFGSTEEMERHAFLKFHVFGFTGEGNLIPFFSMNNYIVQQWSPNDNDGFDVKHYEVAYYSEFDSYEAIEEWTNPLTDEVLEMPHFVLGPVPRQYGPGLGQGVDSFAPDPLNITMIGDRVYIPTLTRLRFPSTMSVEEWGPYGSAPERYWDSMLVYSANIEDVLDDSQSHVPAEIHMQNLVSWDPYFKMGDSPGRTMVRAYGQHISGYDDLPETVRSNLEKYTPEIFDLESWQETRLDAVDFMKELIEKRASGTLDIDQPDYEPRRVKRFEELEGL